MKRKIWSILILLMALVSCAGIFSACGKSRQDLSLESTTKFNELLEDESMWQFGAKYAFGTINHMTSKNTAITMLDRCPAIFKAMEIFNQGYSTGWNENFKSAFDGVLKSGYKILISGI